MLHRSPTSTQVGTPDLRLFFALWPEAGTRQAIYKASRDALAAADGKAVPAENLHMTLVFLGRVATEALPLVKSIAASVQAERFRLELDRYGYWKEPQVLWCGTSRVSAAATSLAAKLRERLMQAGFRPDSQDFIPHVTLARKVRAPGALGGFGPLSWYVDEFALVSSVTGKTGSEYSPLATYALGARREYEIMGTQGLSHERSA
jgi:2'-5' RNA ligase